MSLKSARLKRGLTQQQLEALSGVNAVTISRIEHEKIKPENITLRTAIQLAKALQVSPEELLQD